MKRFRKLLIAALMALLPAQAAFADVTFFPWQGASARPFFIAVGVVAAFLVFVYILSKRK